MFGWERAASWFTKAVWKELSGALEVSDPSIGVPGAAASMAETYAWNSVKKS
jgi:hypothetical protein